MPVNKDNLRTALAFIGIIDQRWIQRVVITPDEIEVTRYKSNDRTGKVTYDEGLELETYTIEVI